MKQSLLALCLALVLTVAITGCGDEDETPDRAQMEVIRKALFSLETAMATGDSVALNKLLGRGELTSDSVLQLVANNGGARFEKIGDYQIAYDDRVASVKCVLTDSAATDTLPVNLIYKYAGTNLWLLKEIQLREMHDEDSVQTH